MPKAMASCCGGRPKAAPVPAAAQAADVAELMRLAEEMEDTERLAMASIREAGYLGWRNYWLEAAFWDVRGKVEGKPLWQLLGGDASALRGKRLPVYASTGEVHPPERRAEEVLGLYEAGFRTVKLRVHSFDEAEDIAQLEAVRQAVGERMAIAVDANQGWRVALIDDAPLWTLERATEFARACADQGIPVEGGEEEGYTSTHQVVIRVSGFGDGKEIATRLENNNIVTNYQALPDDETFYHPSGIRMGVSEMTRFGMEPEDFGELAEMIRDVVIDGATVTALAGPLRSHPRGSPPDTPGRP